MLSKELLNMSVELVIMDYFIVKSLICLLLVFLILIRLVMLMIEKAPLVGVFMLEPILLLGWVKSKILCLCLLQRQNILLLEVVVHSFSG